MADTLPSPNDKTVVVNNSHSGRLWALVVASLALNALILVLLVVGAIIHHHRMHHGFAGRDGRGSGYFDGHCQLDGRHHFHHFGGQDWGLQGGFDQRGGNGPGGYAPGMPGMMGGPMDQPDPAKMSYGILNHLSTTLSLTDDEKAKIKPIIEQQVAEIQKQMEAQRQAIQKQIEDARAKIKPLLTADQEKALDALPLPGQKPPATEAQKTGP